MYDNIIMKADLISIGRENFFLQAQSFQNSIIHIKDGIAEKVMFYLGNLKVSVTPEKVVITGSICKYHLGTNQYTLTRQTAEEAFNQLSQDLELPISQFDVKYFEFESNLIMDHKVPYYYRFLGKCKGIKKKGKIGSTLYYNNTYRRVSFYDKIAEINSSKKQQDQVIKEFEGKNILRFGVRYQKTVCKKLNRASLTVSDLYSKEFYNEMIDRWKQEYFNIEKHKIETFDDSVFMKTKSIIRQYAAWGVLAKGGIDVALDRIEQASQKQVFKFGTQKQRRIDDIMSLFEDESLFKTDDSIIELDRKINEEADRHYCLG